MHLPISNLTHRRFIRLGVFGGTAMAVGFLCQTRQRHSPDFAIGLPDQNREPFPVAIEIDETHVCVAVGKRCTDGFIELLGVSFSPLTANDSIPATVTQAVVDAESQSSVMIRSATVIAPDSLCQQLTEIGRQTQTAFHLPAPHHDCRSRLRGTKKWQNDPLHAPAICLLQFC
jgi:hypothetical protein